MSKPAFRTAASQLPYRGYQLQNPPGMLYLLQEPAGHPQSFGRERGDAEG
jgi:hypothetical protein